MFNEQLSLEWFGRVGCWHRSLMRYSVSYVRHLFNSPSCSFVLGARRRERKKEARVAYQPRLRYSYDMQWRKTPPSPSRPLALSLSLVFFRPLSLFSLLRSVNSQSTLSCIRHLCTSLWTLAFVSQCMCIWLCVCARVCVKCSQSWISVVRVSELSIYHDYHCLTYTHRGSSTSLVFLFLFLFT